MPQGKQRDKLFFDPTVSCRSPCPGLATTRSTTRAAPAPSADSSSSTLRQPARAASRAATRTRRLVLLGPEWPHACPHFQVGQSSCSLCDLGYEAVNGSSCRACSPGPPAQKEFWYLCRGLPKSHWGSAPLPCFLPFQTRLQPCQRKAD